MQSLKLAFKAFNSKSPSEKILIKLLNQSSPNVSEEKHIRPLSRMFIQASQTESPENPCLLFNVYLRDCKNWISAFKFLYASHELMNIIGEKFCRSFLQEHFENIHDLMKSKNVEDYVHAVLAANYYNFLIMYAKYLPDIKKFQHKDPARSAKDLQKGEYDDLVRLVTFKNLIKYFTKVEESIEGSANVLPESPLIDKISVVLFRDVIVIYNIICLQLEHLMGVIFQLESGLALLLDQLYSEMIQITNKLQQIIKKLNVQKSIKIPPINYFKMDLEFNRQEELFILDLKKARQGAPEKPEPYQAYMQQYQTLAPGRKLYKLNTKAGQFTKISENEGPKIKDYFNLQSPEPSELEGLDDDSYTPMKLNECNNNEDSGDDDNGKVLFPVAESESNGKDKREGPIPLQLELVSPKTRLATFEDDDRAVPALQLDGVLHKGRAESVLFTPTSSHHQHNTLAENLLLDSPNPFLVNKQQNNQRLFAQDENLNKKKLNLNPANF